MLRSSGIQEILSDHRSTLIMGIPGDLPTYLQFKFYTKVDKEMQAHYRVPSQEFFKEIDSALDEVLKPTQLTLMK